MGSEQCVVRSMKSEAYVVQCVLLVVQCVVCIVPCVVYGGHCVLCSG